MKRLFKKQVSSSNMKNDLKMKKMTNVNMKLKDIMQQQEAKKKMKMSIKSEETKKLLNEHKKALFSSKNPLFQALGHQKQLQKGVSINEEDYKMYDKMFNDCHKSQIELKQSVTKFKKKNDWIISYYNRAMLKFDFLVCILIYYDCFSVPFEISFGWNELSDSSMKVLYVIDLIKSMIFVMDVLLCFRRAYKDELTGLEERDFRLIAIRYLKYYFWVDMTAAFPYRFLGLNWMKFLKLAKILRLFRLQRIISFLQIETRTRRSIRLLYLFITLLIIIHFVTCYLYSHFSSTWADLHSDLHLEDFDTEKHYLNAANQTRMIWRNDYWVPPVEVVYGKTDFYDLPVDEKYKRLFYYSFLLIVGNDISPQNHSDFVIFTLIIFIGAFLEAYIIGGMTAELQRRHDNEQYIIDNYEYMMYSLDIHKIPNILEQKIVEYIKLFSDNLEVTVKMKQLFDYMNPSLQYKAIE